MEEDSNNKSGPQDLRIPSDPKTEDRFQQEDRDQSNQGALELPNSPGENLPGEGKKEGEDHEAIQVKVNEEEVNLKKPDNEKQIAAATNQKKENPHYPYDQVPPAFDKAKIHGRAKRVYAAQSEIDRTSELAQHKTKKICECCGNGYDLEKISLCSSKSEMYHLGVGFPLYFDFIIYCGVLAIIMLLVSGIYNFVTNRDANDCEVNLDWSRDDAQFCDLSKIASISLVNKRFSMHEMNVSNWFNLAAVVVMVISFQFYRRQSILTIEEVDNSQQTPADYTLAITNLPKDATDEEVREFLEKKVFPEKKVDVAKIVRGYNITEYVRLNRRRVALKYELSKEQVKDKEKKEQELNQVRLSLEALEKDSTLNLEKSPYAYITFEREEDAREAIRRLGFNPLIKKLFYILGCYGCFRDIRFRGNIKLLVHRAPEPTDILWENLGTDVKEKKKRRLITFFVSILMIIICFAIIIGINVGKAKLSNPERLQDTNVQKSRSVGTEVISVVIALVIMVINNALNFSTRIFASYESRSTFTEYFVSVSQRLTTAMFINTAITLLVTHIILETLWKDGGLLNDVFIVFIIIVVVGPLSNLFNPWYFLRLYRRWKAKRQGSNCKLTQEEANLLFEGPPIDIAQNYANVLKTIWVTAFYAPVLPIGVPLAVLGLFLSYWTDKYLLLNRYVRPSALGKSLSLWMAEYLELSPFFFAVGNIVFRSLIKRNDDDNVDDPILPTILGLAISFAHFLVPAHSIAKKCFSSSERDYSYKQTYSQARVRFNNDYDICNPIYHDVALQNWRKIVEQAANGQAPTDLQPHTSHNIKHAIGAMQNIRHYAQFTQGLSQVRNPHYQAGVPPTRPNFAQIIPPQNVNFGQSIPYQPVSYPTFQNSVNPQYVSAGGNYAPVNNPVYGGQPYPQNQWQQQRPPVQMMQQPMMYTQPQVQPQQFRPHNAYANQHIPNQNFPQYQQPQNGNAFPMNQNRYNVELQPNHNNPPTNLNFFQNSGQGGYSQN